jgi:hypothetical protein
MTIKDELMVIVRAFNALITGSGTAQQLADAQAQIAALKAADQLTDAEQAEVDSALTNAAAAPAPTTAQVATVTAGGTGGTGA